MQFSSTFATGDKGWCFDMDRGPVLRTIGRISIEYTHSPGTGDNMFDNYKAKGPELVETYMCVETGIGSGSVYTLGEHIFATEEECKARYAEVLAKQERERQERRDRQREDRIRRLRDLRREIASLKAQGAA